MTRLTYPIRTCSSKGNGTNMAPGKGKSPISTRQVRSRTSRRFVEVVWRGRLMRQSIQPKNVLLGVCRMANQGPHKSRNSSTYTPLDTALSLILSMLIIGLQTMHTAELSTTTAPGEGRSRNRSLSCSSNSARDNLLKSSGLAVQTHDVPRPPSLGYSLARSSAIVTSPTS